MPITKSSHVKVSMLCKVLRNHKEDIYEASVNFSCSVSVFMSFRSKLDDKYSC